MPAPVDDADEYGDATSTLDDFGVALASLISELLRDSGVNVHSVDFRVKARGSATRKIAGNGDRYAGFSDLHDLLGVRVITYFSDEVDSAAAVLVPEFDVDEDNSVDKRSALDPDRFGYLSLHYVASLTDKRSSLVEYRRFAGRQFELQIRSILQHAWAEIEHDLGYKASGTIPREARRRFSRLAGLLELADDEFQRLRVELAAYEKVVEATIVSDSSGLEVDQSTVHALIRSGVLDELSGAVARMFPAQLSPRFSRSFSARMAEELVSLGVDSIESVQSRISSWAPYAAEFARLWIPQERGESDISRSVHRGIGLFYLVYALAGASDDATRVRWAQERRLNGADLAERVKDVWASVVEDLGSPPDN